MYRWWFQVSLLSTHLHLKRNRIWRVLGYLTISGAEVSLEIGKCRLAVYRIGHYLITESPSLRTLMMARMCRFLSTEVLQFYLLCDLQIRKSRIQGTHLTPAWMLVLTSLIPPVMLTFTMPGLDTFWLPCSYFPLFLDVNYLFRRWWSLLSISFLQRFMEVHRYAAVILIPIAHGFRK